MKVAYAVLLPALSARSRGANAFLAAPPGHSVRLPSSAKSASLFPYALRSAESSSTPDDPYATLIDAISHAADAAYSAAQHSEQLAYNGAKQMMMLASSSALSSSTQAGLSTLENNIVSSSDPSVMMQAIYDALDSSIHAAEMAASSTSVLVHNLANFDEAFSTSLALANNHNMMLLSPEYADVAQAKLALLLHNLSGLTLEDNFLANFVAEVDKQLVALLPASSSSSEISTASTTSNVLFFGTVAAVLAYTQRQAGIEEYKMKLRSLLERGELDIATVGFYCFVQSLTFHPLSHTQTLIAISIYYHAMSSWRKMLECPSRPLLRHSKTRPTTWQW